MINRIESPDLDSPSHRQEAVTWLKAFNLLNFSPLICKMKLSLLMLGFDYLTSTIMFQIKGKYLKFRY